MLIKHDEITSDWIEKNGHQISVNGNEYFYFPYWMEKISEGVYRELKYEDLPESVIKMIKTIRSKP